MHAVQDAVGSSVEAALQQVLPALLAEVPLRESLEGALRSQLEESRREAGDAAAGALDHTDGAGFQRVRSESSRFRRASFAYSARAPVCYYTC